MKPYMEGPWEQRLSLEQPVLVLSQNCIYSVPLPAPPVTTTHCSQSLPRTAEGPGCADRGCRTSVETTRLCHSWETSLEAGGHSVPSPAQIHKNQLVPRCQSNAMLEGSQPRLSSGTTAASWSQRSQSW